jgi:hypothetical protein
MRPFPHVQMEQDNLIELFSQYGEYLADSEKVSHAGEIYARRRPAIKAPV